MREIKFRAWDKREKKIVTRGLLSTLQRGLSFFDASGFNMGYAENDRYILMQYTGLKDKNGEEIYEGDLIRNESGRICEVKWHEKCGQWDAFVKIIVENDNASGFSPEAWQYSVKKIGDIYENSDLLKEHKNASI